jgi:hypothetical protein
VPSRWVSTLQGSLRCWLVQRCLDHAVIFVTIAVIYSRLAVQEHRMILQAVDRNVPE